MVILFLKHATPSIGVEISRIVDKYYKFLELCIGFLDKSINFVELSSKLLEFIKYKEEQCVDFSLCCNYYGYNGGVESLR